LKELRSDYLFIRPGVLRFEYSGCEETDCLFSHFIIVHQKGVRSMHDTVLFHALNLRALNSCLAVIRPLYHHAVDPVDGPVSGKNAFLLSA
jgi:hypothetical protein